STLLLHVPLSRLKASPTRCSCVRFSIFRLCKTYAEKLMGVLISSSKNSNHDKEVKPLDELDLDSFNSERFGGSTSLLVFLFINLWFDPAGGSLSLSLSLSLRPLFKEYTLPKSQRDPCRADTLWSNSNKDTKSRRARIKDVVGSVVGTRVGVVICGIEENG
nr:hypothetical protein [Tanacetum cinerariifolium]